MALCSLFFKAAVMCRGRRASRRSKCPCARSNVAKEENAIASEKAGLMTEQAEELPPPQYEDSKN